MKARMLNRDADAPPSIVSRYIQTVVDANGTVAMDARPTAHGTWDVVFLDGSRSPDGVHEYFRYGAQVGARICSVSAQPSRQGYLVVVGLYPTPTA